MSYKKRLQTISDAVKRVEYSISDNEHKIRYAEKRITKLKDKKAGLLHLIERYPEAKYSNGDLYLDGVGDNWDKIAGMSIERSYGKDSRGYINYRDLNLTVKFSLNKKSTHTDVKVYMIPPENLLAVINSASRSGGSILVHDYKRLFPESCKRRKSFIRRIKYHILDIISRRKLTIDNNSFDKEELMKLMLLK